MSQQVAIDTEERYGKIRGTINEQRLFGMKGKKYYNMFIRMRIKIMRIKERMARAANT